MSCDRGCVVTWSHGCGHDFGRVVWLYGRMVVWRCGRAVMWSCSCAGWGLRGRGIVVVWS